MGKKKYYEAYLETALQIFFDKYWMEPEQAGEEFARHILETCKTLFPDMESTNGTMPKIRINWLYRMCDSFNKAINEFIN